MMKLFSIFGSKGFLVYFFLNFFLLKAGAWAAPCCARNAATPSLIVGDDRAQVNLGYSLASAVAEAANDGSLSFFSSSTSDLSQVFRLDGSFLLSDRFQLGASASWVKHFVSQWGLSDSVMGWGDSRLSLAYELIPVWSYSKWKPQVFVFSSLAFPTGRSKYEAENFLLADIRGNGFYGISLGGLVLKYWSSWDLFLLPEIHFSFPRQFQDQANSIYVYPRFGGSLGFGGGWNYKVFRFGVRIQPRLDQSTVVILSNRTLQMQTEGFLSVCDTGLDSSVLLSASDSLMLSYTDQTLLGVAMNLNVNRTIALNFQHRWER